MPEDALQQRREQLASLRLCRELTKEEEQELELIQRALAQPEPRPDACEYRLGEWNNV